MALTSTLFEKPQDYNCKTCLMRLVGMHYCALVITNGDWPWIKLSKKVSAYESGCGNQTLDGTGAFAHDVSYGAVTESGITLSSEPVALQPRSERRKIGLIALSTDLTTERDFARIIPLDRAGIYATRVTFANPTTPDNLRQMAPRITDAAALILPGEALDAICYSCTSASVVIGDAEIAALVHAARPNVPVVTPNAAALQAFAALGVRHVSVLTPYVPHTGAVIAAYFRNHGLTVEGFSCLGLEDDRDMARVEPETILRAALATDTDATQAFFVSCTALGAADVIEDLERQTGKPVVTSNQASAWALMHHAGLVQSSSRWGQLFQYAMPDHNQDRCG